MVPIIIAASVGICVAALIGGVALMMRDGKENRVEDRLAGLALAGRKDEGKERLSLLDEMLEDSGSAAERFLSRFGNIQLFMEQAGVNISAGKIVLFCTAMAVAGAIFCLIVPVSKWFLPIFAIIPAPLPFLYLIWRRNRRLDKFGSQLPEAMELLSRSLRAGHSLGAGMGLIADEMPDPIGKEFGRCFDEQNFGVSLETALDQMTQRVPNLDLRFFATAVILQRQTGGDLAEIMDKIGKLIRDRIKLAGQIQALTGEGRLSGIVLLALPPLLFVVMFFLNNEYCMVLLNDPTGRKLLAVAIVMQVLGALMIRKIINVKV